MTVATPFVLTPEAAQLEETTTIRQWLETAKGFSRPMISNFQVGALALGNSGRIYMGCNLEFKGLDFSYAVHAEQFALSMAHHAEETGIKALFVSEMPCGHCRQFLMELGHADLPIVVLDDRGRVDVSLKDLLLFPFTMGQQHLMTPHSAALILTHPHPDTLIHTAVKSADRAYVPYTQSHAGVALSLSSGQIVTGWSIESAAFNPTMNPLCMALCQLVSLQQSYDAVTKAALVKREGSLIDYTHQISHWLKAYAPKAELLIETAEIARL